MFRETRWQATKYVAGQIATIGVEALEEIADGACRIIIGVYGLGILVPFMLVATMVVWPFTLAFGAFQPKESPDGR